MLYRAKDIVYASALQITVKCIKMCGVNNIADAVAMCKDKFIKIYLSISSVVCDIYSLIVK